MNSAAASRITGRVELGGDAVPAGGFKDFVRALARRRNAKNRLKRPAVETPFGFKVSGPTEMQDGTFEQEGVGLIRKIMGQSDLFINVGANVGYYCCFAQQQGLRTYAIEPLPINAALLMKNMRSNDWGPNVTVLPVAVGDTSGIVDMYGEGTGASLVKGWARNPMSLAKEVPVVRLDDVVPPAGSGEQVFVLMDVEGFELYALRGASNLLNAETKPVWMIEINLTWHQPGGADLSATAGETFEIMKSAGYDVYEVGSSVRPLEWAEVEAACAGQPSDITSHNFLFLERGRSIDAVLGA